VVPGAWFVDVGRPYFRNRGTLRNRKRRSTPVALTGATVPLAPGVKEPAKALQNRSFVRGSSSSHDLQSMATRTV
jgi:hypothetical protein